MMLRLPIFTGEGVRGLVVSEAEERKVQLLNTALKVSNKSTDISWTRCFQEGEGQTKGVMLVAFLSY